MVSFHWFPLSDNCSQDRFFVRFLSGNMKPVMQNAVTTEPYATSSELRLPLTGVDNAGQSCAGLRNPQQEYVNRSNNKDIVIIIIELIILIILSS